MKYIYTTLVATLMFTGTSFAETINVPGDQPTIAAAISASVNGDVIAIAAGTYYEHSLNPNGKAITIQGTLNKDESLATTIDAQQGGAVFVIESGEGVNTVIQDLVITGGFGFNSHGGGISCQYESSPTIINCTIVDNKSFNRGGGITCSYNCNPAISNCTIEGNTGFGTGGGIFCYYYSSPTISDCTLSGNIAIADFNGDDYGGGVYCVDNSSPTISGCTITGNTADYGAGIYYRDSSSPVITGCTITGNTADYGGGIYCENSSHLPITDCMIAPPRSR